MCDKQGCCVRCGRWRDLIIRNRHGELLPASERLCRACKFKSTKPGACRACGKVVQALRPSSLCWVCYNTPSIRAAHPTTSKFAPKNEHDPIRVPACPEPTDRYPGQSKLAVLEARAMLGVDLWHPLDAQIPD